MSYQLAFAINGKKGNKILQKSIQITVNKAGGGGGGEAPFWTSDQALSTNKTYDGNTFLPGNVILCTRAGSGDKKFKVENGVISWTGQRTRIYNIVSNLSTMPENAFKNIGFEFEALRTESSGDRNMSVKFGNHGTDLWADANRWTFGGYGFAVERTRIGSKVEFYHNDHGCSEEKDLSEPIPLNQFLGYKFAWQNDEAKKEKVLTGWIRYPSDTTFKQVVQRRMTKSCWDPPSVPSGKNDTNEIKAGPYLGPCHHVWIRNNEVGRLDVKNMKAYSIPAFT